MPARIVLLDSAAQLRCPCRLFEAQRTTSHFLPLQAALGAMDCAGNGIDIHV